MPVGSGLILEHLDEAGERQLHRTLVELAAGSTSCFQPLFLPMTSTDVLPRAVDDLATRFVQVILDLAVFPLHCKSRAIRFDEWRPFIRSRMLLLRLAICLL